MATTTLTVPAKHIEAWRDAVLVELRNDAKGLVDNIESAQRTVMEDRSKVERALVIEKKVIEPTPVDLSDVLWPRKAMRQEYEILEASFADVSGDLEVPGDTEALAHICETMASKIVPPKISEATWTSPYSDEVEGEISTVVEALTWAAREASRLQALWAKQFEAEKKAEVA